MKKSKKTLLKLTLSLFLLVGCQNETFENPGDFLSGGGSGEVASTIEDPTEDVKNEFIDVDFSSLKNDTSLKDALEVPQSEEIYEIHESGSYLFKGNYKGIKLCEDNLKLHLIFDGVEMNSSSNIIIDGSEHKKAEVVITLLNENKIESSLSGENAIHIKGKLFFNGTGSLAIHAEGKNAIKVSKEIMIIDCSLTLNAKNHAISGLSILAKDCNINVISAGKDGLNAECEDETTAFTTNEGYVYLKDVVYSSISEGDGIQADTIVYIDGGSYNIKTNGSFVEDTTQNRNEYDLTSDDFRYIKNGNDYQKIASDYMGRETKYALKQGCKGIKVAEIEYPDPNDESNEITVTNGDYSIIIEDGTFTINSTDDAIHSNSGNLSINGGTFSIDTYDDALTSDNLTKISGGTININSSYEGIEGGYVEISGGNIHINSSDDGINAASDDNKISEHIIISNGEIYVNALGDGIDSNGSILISGGKTFVAGPTSAMDCAIDSDKGTVIDGGYLFAVGPLGMVETPSKNSTQYIVSFARNQAISANTNLSLTDEDGSSIFSFLSPKACQSVIISCPELEKGKTYQIFGGDSSLATFEVNDIITLIGSAGGITNPGGNPPGGHGPGGFGPGGR